MIKRLSFFPVIVCILTGCHAAPIGDTPPVVKELTVGKVKYDEYSVNSFEQPNSCEGFDLTDADLLEFFQKARSIPADDNRAFKRLQFSKCQIRGSGVLENGYKVFFTIDRARNADLSIQTDSLIPYGGIYHCAECTSEKFYPPGWKATSNRPVIKNVSFEENGAWSENMSSQSSIVTAEGCKDFLLTEDDVREFFNVARPSHRREFMNELDASCCYASGTAILQDGRNTTWFIDRFRRGEMLIQGGSPLYYYGAEVNSPLYSEVCDIDCIRGETED